MIIKLLITEIMTMKITHIKIKQLTRQITHMITLIITVISDKKLITLIITQTITRIITRITALTITHMTALIITDNTGNNTTRNHFEHQLTRPVSSQQNDGHRAVVEGGVV